MSLEGEGSVLSAKFVLLGFSLLLLSWTLGAYIGALLSNREMVAVFFDGTAIPINDGAATNPPTLLLPLSVMETEVLSGAGGIGLKGGMPRILVSKDFPTEIKDFSKAPFGDVWTVNLLA